MTKQSEHPTGDYEVGYGKPPKHTQFKSGKSGNPNGRPKGAKNFATELNEVMQEKIMVQENGRRRSISTQRALIKRTRNRALEGDAKATSSLITMLRAFQVSDELHAAEGISTMASWRSTTTPQSAPCAP